MKSLVFALCVPLWFGACTGSGDSDSDVDLDMITTDAVPGKRSEVLAASHEPTNQIMIFGGNDGPVVNQVPSARFLGDTWIFEPGVGWSQVESADSPKRRGRYAVSVDSAGNRALLFGGRFRRDNASGNYQLFNDVWAFDFVSHEWSKLSDGSGTAPLPRYYPASGYDSTSDTFYIWGGLTNSNPLAFQKAEDLWAFKDGSWTEVPTSGDAPSSRTFYGQTFDTTRKQIIVFGGQIGDFQSTSFQDLYALDVTTGVWERLHNGTDRPRPSTRMHAHIVYDEANDRYLLWGGHTDIGDANDLWAFDPVAKTWSAVRRADRLNGTGVGCNGNASEVPKSFVDIDVTAPERRHRGMFALMHDSLWIATGIHAECSDQLNDTWRYDLEKGEYVELIGATSGESCERRGDDCQCLCI